MAFLETTRKAIVRLIDPNPNKSAETQTSQPLPAVDYTPANVPGSHQQLRQHCWYTLVGLDARELGYAFICRCGYSNVYLFGKFDLRRELEHDHHCGARCMAIVEKAKDHQGLPVYERVVLTEKDDKGNPIPVGASHNLLSVLPDNGLHMSDTERNKWYATLPHWQMGNTNTPKPPFTLVGDWGDNAPSADKEGWAGNVPLGSDGRWV